MLNTYGWLKLDRGYLKTHAEHRWMQELNRRTIFECLPSNGTVTVFQTSRPEFCPPFRSQTLKKALLSLHEALKGPPSLF